MSERAARLAKLDLRSAMVGEFPELQGVMGRYYALAAGEPAEVADAARDHYSPLGPTDAVPTAPVSVAVALADKIDTLVHLWIEGEKPTGSKDPFALRRAAIGIIRVILGGGFRLGVEKVFLVAANAAPRPNQLSAQLQSLTAKFVVLDHQLDWLSNRNRHDQEELETEDDLTLKRRLLMLSMERTERDHLQLTIEQSEIASQYAAVELEYRELTTAKQHAPADLLSFLHDRLMVFLRDDGIRHDVIDAALAMPGNDDLTLGVARARALQAFLKTDDGENLLQGFRRANNILTQAESADGVEYSYGADRKFAEHPAETALFDALDAAEAAIAPALESEDFATAMSAMAALRAPIDAFFTAVQVNSDNSVTRRNRLNLLSRIRRLCLSTADLTRIEG